MRCRNSQPSGILLELISAFLTIVLISFTYNIGVGMTAGLLVYPLLKLITGRVSEVPRSAMAPGRHVAVFYLVHPYK